MLWCSSSDDGEPLACEQGLEDAANVEGTSLHDSATDKLADMDADVDDALECEMQRERSDR